MSNGSKRVARYRVGLNPDRPLVVAEGALVACGSDASRIASAALAGLVSERLIVIGLNSRNRVVGIVTVAEGGDSALCVHAKEVLRAALLLGGTAFVLAHNHPGGDPFPSPHDLSFTKKVAEGSRAIGTNLVDHVVVAPEAGTHYSFLEHGLLEEV
jgi:DNA repair protein RadC